MNTPTYFQDLWENSTCYGCGPGNHDGLLLKSRWSDDGRFVIAEFNGEAKYNSGIPNVMYGGTVASLIDCHSIWTAIAFAHKEEGRDVGSTPFIVYVTGKLSVKFIRPTPLSKPVHIKAWVEGDIGKKIHVACELGPETGVTATGQVTAIKLGK